MFALALSGMSIGQMAIAILIVVGIVAIVFIITKAMGLPLPPWLIQVFWVLVLVVVGIFCIRFLMSL